MNERGVEVLVSGALRGVRQIPFRHGDAEGGRCAIGLMLEAMHEAHGCGVTASDAMWDDVDETEFDRCYGTDEQQRARICAHNNGGVVPQWDFLTIARKLGPDHA